MSIREASMQNNLSLFVLLYFFSSWLLSKLLKKTYIICLKVLGFGVHLIVVYLFYFLDVKLSYFKFNSQWWLYAEWRNSVNGPQCLVLELVAKYVPSDSNEIFDMMNLLEDRLQHANGAVVLATISCFCSWHCLWLMSINRCLSMIFNFLVGFWKGCSFKHRCWYINF